MPEDNQHIRLAVVSTWPPKTCGIATFTADLLRHASLMHGYLLDYKLLAIADPNDHLAYGSEVRQIIDKEDPGSLERAARWINASGANVVSLQHEFGIWGGFDGAFVVDFLDMVRVPVLTTLHTVPLAPSAFGEGYRLSLLDAIARRSSGVVTFLPAARDYLIKQCAIDPARASVLWHGAPAYPELDREAAKEALGLAGRTVLSTFGLLNRFKGIDDALQALAGLVHEQPSLLYLVLGQPHPAEPAHFYIELQRLAEQLGLTDHVRFVNRFLSEEDLECYLAATDIYMTPYHDLAQISSGTLTRALAAGRLIVSTPYLYAQAALAEDRGVLAPARDPAALAGILQPLLADPAARASYEQRARAFGQSLSWTRIAPRYLELALQIAGTALPVDRPVLLEAGGGA